MIFLNLFLCKYSGYPVPWTAAGTDWVTWSKLLHETQPSIVTGRHLRTEIMLLIQTRAPKDPLGPDSNCINATVKGHQKKKTRDAFYF